MADKHFKNSCGDRCKCAGTVRHKIYLLELKTVKWIKVSVLTHMNGLPYGQVWSILTPSQARKMLVQSYSPGFNQPVGFIHSRYCLKVSMASQGSEPKSGTPGFSLPGFMKWAEVTQLVFNVAKFRDNILQLTVLSLLCELIVSMVLGSVRKSLIHPVRKTNSY